MCGWAWSFLFTLFFVQFLIKRKEISLPEEKGVSLAGRFPSLCVGRWHFCYQIFIETPLKPCSLCWWGSRDEREPLPHTSVRRVWSYSGWTLWSATGSWVTLGVAWKGYGFTHSPNERVRKKRTTGHGKYSTHTPAHTSRCVLRNRNHIPHYFLVVWNYLCEKSNFICSALSRPSFAVTLFPRVGWDCGLPVASEPLNAQWCTVEWKGCFLLSSAFKRP